MEQIIADNISKSFGGPAVVANQSFRVLAGDSIGLVGPNGAGKTTLVRILSGQLRPDSGKVVRAPSTRIACVEQHPRLEEAESLEELLRRRVEPERRRLAEAEALLSEATEETLASRLADYERATVRFEAAGGYDALDRGLAVLSGLGLEVPADRMMSSLSGGEVNLVRLAAALVSRPDLLILDEPGNHLDYLGLAWLERFLKAWQGSLVVISHNRYLLDSVCRTIWHLEWGKLTRFTGSYTDFRREWERTRAQREHEYRQSDRRARELELRVKELRSIASSRYNPPVQVLNKLGAAKRKLAQTLEARGERPRRERRVGLDLDGRSSHADIALSFNGLDLEVGGRALLRDASLHIACGERVALVGRNGSGKSSLLKRIVREGGWGPGPIRIGPSLELGYLRQVPEFSRPTIVEEVRSWGPLSVDQAYAIVAPFLFDFDDLSKPIEALSGGEQNRLQLARLVYRNASFLVLDEPTNHMDIPSREAIESALARFDGTLLVVSHDRYFLNGLVDRVVEIDQGRLASYEGDFSEFFAARYPTLPKLSGTIGRRGAERAEEDDKRNDREPSGQPVGRPGGARPAAGEQLSGDAAARPAPTDWEAAIGRMERELAELRLAAEEARSAGHGEEAKTREDHAALLADRIEKAYRRWIEEEG